MTTAPTPDEQEREEAKSLAALLRQFALQAERPSSMMRNDLRDLARRLENISNG